MSKITKRILRSKSPFDWYVPDGDSNVHEIMRPGVIRTYWRVWYHPEKNELRTTLFDNPKNVKKDGWFYIGRGDF